MKRKINYIVIHCTATMQNVDFRASDIDKWHRHRGFNSIGYHYVIDLDGTIEVGRPESVVGAHVKDFNVNSIGIVYVGGLAKDATGQVIPADTRTEAQKKALVNLLTELKKKYPNAEILGHKDFPNVRKACPCFDAKKEYHGIS